MSNSHKQSMNIWKILFFTLVIVITLPILVLMFSSSNQGELNTQEFVIGEDVISLGLTVQSSDIEQIANVYLQDQSESSNVDYAVQIDETVDLYGQASYLGIPFDFSAEMNPIVESNGNLTLAIESIQLSGFEMPQQLTLSILASQIELPDFMVFNPSESYIAVNFNEFAFENGTRISVIDLDPNSGEINIAIHVPSEVIELDDNGE